MTDDLTALRALAEKATPGPWVADCCRAGNAVYGRSDSIGVDATREDAEFIAAANPTAVIRLLDRLDSAVTAIERVQALTQFEIESDNGGTMFVLDVDEVEEALAAFDTGKETG